MTNGLPDLLKGLSPEDASEVLALGKRLLLSSGAELFHLGQDADALHVIQRGRIRLTLPMQLRGHDEQVLVEERTPGQTVGWSALIPPYRFTLTATAPLETEVVSFSREPLLAHFAEHPAVAQTISLNLASVIGQRLQLFQTMWLREMQRTVELRYA
ncbi:MAG TPA: cyclic nucleotide-binding domain-containing protein [Verrucomicrobiae bacterium]|nr:cyclic nucleotide-binding domain-containing protein [Verrucomicrobiae bacterium]